MKNKRIINKKRKEVINMILHTVMIEPEIPQNTREYRKDLCNNRLKTTFSTSIRI